MLALQVGVLLWGLALVAAGPQVQLPPWCISEPQGNGSGPNTGPSQRRTCNVAPSTAAYIVEGRVPPLYTAGPGADLATFDIKSAFKPEGLQAMSDLTLKTELGASDESSLINLPQFSSASSLALTNVNIMVNNCEAWTALGNYLCNHEELWKSGAIAAIVTSKDITIAGVYKGRSNNSSIPITTDNVKLSCVPAAGRTAMPPKCTISNVDRGDELWEALSAAAVTTQPAGSPQSAPLATAWILVTESVSLDGPILAAAASTWQRAAATNQPPTAGVTFSFQRPVKIVGMSRQVQLHFNGSAAMGLMGVHQDGGSLTFSNLTLTGLPGGWITPPYGDYPWALSTMFMWNVVLKRLGEEGAGALQPVPRDKLVVDNCTIVVPDDELLFWTLPDQGLAVDEPYTPLAFILNANTSNSAAFISSDVSVSVSADPVSILQQMIDGVAPLSSLAVAATLKLTVNSMAARTGAWRMSNVQVVAHGAEMLQFPVTPTVAGLMSLAAGSDAFNAGNVLLRAWTDVPDIAAAPGAAPVPVSPQIVLPAESRSNKGDARRQRSIIVRGHVVVETSYPALQARDLPDGFVLSGVLTERELCALGLGNVPSGAAIVEEDYSVALRHVNLFNLPVYKPVEHRREDKSDDDMVSSDIAKLGNLTSLLWPFNVQRDEESEEGTLELTDVVLYIPPQELRLYISHLKAGSDGWPPVSTIPESLLPRGTLLPIRAALLNMADLGPPPRIFNPDLNASLAATAQIVFPRFQWFGLEGENVIFRTVLREDSMPLGWSFTQSPLFTGFPPPASSTSAAGPQPPAAAANRAPSPSPAPGAGTGSGSGNGSNGSSTGGASINGGSPEGNDDKYRPRPDTSTSTSDGVSGTTLGLAVGLSVGGAFLISAAVGVLVLRHQRARMAKSQAAAPAPSGFTDLENGKGAGGVTGKGAGFSDASGMLPYSTSSSDINPMMGQGMLVAGGAPGHSGSTFATTLEPGGSIGMTGTQLGDAPSGTNSTGAVGAAAAVAASVSTNTPTTATVTAASATAGVRRQRSSTTDGAPVPSASPNPSGRSETDRSNAPVSTKQILSQIFSGATDENTSALDSEEWRDSWTAGEVAEVNEVRLEMQAAVEKMKLTHSSAESQVVLHSVLGRGAFGVAYKGTWRGLEVAVKRILFQLLSSPAGEASRRKALREAAINSTLNHPCIVATYSYDMVPLVSSMAPAPSASKNKPTGVHDWEMSLVMEYCDQGSLAACIKARRFVDKSGRRDMKQILAVAANLASGMAYLHAHRVLHGDLKPDNVLLKSDANSPAGFTAKVGDFGMSMRLGANQTHVSNVHHGTPLYIAPEVLHKAQAARAADVYSFGVLLWELWHGRTAWEQLLRMTEHRPAGRGMAYVPGLFGFEKDAAVAALPGYAELATRCLSTKPAERPSFADIETALEALRVTVTSGAAPAQAASTSAAGSAAGSQKGVAAAAPSVGSAGDKGAACTSPRNGSAGQVGTKSSAAGPSTSAAPDDNGAFAAAAAQAATVATAVAAAAPGEEGAAPGLAEQAPSIGNQPQGSEPLPSEELSDMVSAQEQHSMPVLNLSYQATARMLKHLAPPASASQVAGGSPDRRNSQGGQGAQE